MPVSSNTRTTSFSEAAVEPVEKAAAASGQARNSSFHMSVFLHRKMI
jgi:hypothetical protein